MADALVRFARQRRITHLMLASGRAGGAGGAGGAGRAGLWRGKAGAAGPVVQRVLREATPAGIDVHVMTMAETSGEPVIR